MHSDRALGILANVEELADDFQGRNSAVNEEQVVMIEAGIEEPARVVNLLVQTDDRRDAVLPEVGKVSLRRMERVTWCKKLATSSRTKARRRLDSEKKFSHFFSSYSILYTGNSFAEINCSELRIVLIYAYFLHLINLYKHRKTNKYHIFGLLIRRTGQ